MMSPYLYIAKRLSDGVIKVGFSYDPERRIKQLSSGLDDMDLVCARLTPETNAKLDDEQKILEHVWPAYNARRLEKEFKHKFSKYLIRGEWYKKEALNSIVEFLQTHPMETFSQVWWQDTKEGRKFGTFQCIRFHK